MFCMAKKSFLEDLPFLHKDTSLNNLFPLDNIVLNCSSQHYFTPFAGATSLRILPLLILLQSDMVYKGGGELSQNLPRDR